MRSSSSQRLAGSTIDTSGRRRDRVGPARWLECHTDEVSGKDSVRFVPLKVTTPGGVPRLPLAAAWMKDVRDLVRDEMLATLREHLEGYAKGA